MYTQSQELSDSFAGFLNFIIAVGLITPLVFMAIRGYMLYHLYEEDPEVLEAQDPYQDPATRSGRRMRHKAAAVEELGDAAAPSNIAAVVEERHVSSWLRHSEALTLDAHGDKKDLPVVIEMATVPTMGQVSQSLRDPEPTQMIAGDLEIGNPLAGGDEGLPTPSSPKPKKGTKKKKKKILDPDIAAKTEAALAAAASDEAGLKQPTVRI